MKSNGFGSWEQTIIVHVPKADATEVVDKLQIQPFKEEGEPPRAYFEWKRWTKQRGNGEDIVFELSILFEIGEGSTDWEIDWAASEY